MSNLNSFLVKCFAGEKKVLDVSVNHWNEYVTSLKASDKITIKDVTYIIDNITMVHQETNKGLVVELHVKLNR